LPALSPFELVSSLHVNCSVAVENRPRFSYLSFPLSSNKFLYSVHSVPNASIVLVDLASWN